MRYFILHCMIIWRCFHCGGLLWLWRGRGFREPWVCGDVSSFNFRPAKQSVEYKAFAPTVFHLILYCVYMCVTIAFSSNSMWSSVLAKGRRWSLRVLVLGAQFHLNLSKCKMMVMEKVSKYCSVWLYIYVFMYVYNIISAAITCYWAKCCSRRHWPCTNYS